MGARTRRIWVQAPIGRDPTEYEAYYEAADNSAGLRCSAALPDLVEFARWQRSLRSMLGENERVASDAEKPTVESLKGRGFNAQSRIRLEAQDGFRHGLGVGARNQKD
jgi:hypothetical protein